MGKVRLIFTLGIIGILMSGLGLAAGCTTITGGGFRDLTSLARMAPAGTGIIIYVDIKRLREDTNLGEMYRALVADFDYEFGDMGIRMSDIRHFGVISVDYEAVTVIATDQSLDTVRGKLAEGGQRGDYLGTELWQHSYGQALAIHDGTLLVGTEDSVKVCLNAIHNKHTVYESNADIRHVLLRLSDGLIASLLSLSELSPTIGPAVIIDEKISTTSMIQQSVMKFGSESEAAEAEAEIMASPEEIDEIGLSLSRSGYFLEISWIYPIDLYGGITP